MTEDIEMGDKEPRRFAGNMISASLHSPPLINIQQTSTGCLCEVHKKILIPFGLIVFLLFVALVVAIVLRNL